MHSVCPAVQKKKKRWSSLLDLALQKCFAIIGAAWQPASWNLSCAEVHGGREGCKMHPCQGREPWQIAKVTAVGFEPTPLRTGALSQRLRPLGQTVMLCSLLGAFAILLARSCASTARQEGMPGCITECGCPGADGVPALCIQLHGFGEGLGGS